MAKLGKQKFHISGSYMAARTTYIGDIEIFLYYNTDKDFFYFDREEMKKYLQDAAPDHFFFTECDTKAKAIHKFQSLISTEVIETRMLRVKLGIPSRIWKKKNPNYDPEHKTSRLFEDQYIPREDIPEYLQLMLSKGSCYAASGLSLEFERVMKVEVNGKAYYTSCNEKWQYDRTSMSSYCEGLIDWTEPMETFLLETQSRLDALCEVVLKFFNAGETVEALFEKINSNQKLLE